MTARDTDADWEEIAKKTPYYGVLSHDKYISPDAAALSEFFGVFGSGMGALLAVSILYQYYQTMVQEQVEDLYPFLRGAFS